MIPKRLPGKSLSKPFYSLPKLPASLFPDLPKPDPIPVDGPAGWRDRECFYVTVLDGPRVGLLAGPFPDREQADGMVTMSRTAAEQVDPFAWFYSFGVARIPHGWTPGRINDLLNIDIVNGAIP